jgi:hypothetical protein
VNRKSILKDLSPMKIIKKLNLKKKGMKKLKKGPTFKNKITNVMSKETKWRINPC